MDTKRAYKTILSIVFTIGAVLLTFCGSAQNVKIICMEPSSKPISVVIDYIKFDSVPKVLLSQNAELFKHAKIKKDLKNAKVILLTKMAIKVDDIILVSREEKKKTLSTITESDIAEIQVYNKDLTAENLNIKNKYGSIIIKTKNHILDGGGSKVTQ
jgi:hypothetical protein